MNWLPFVCRYSDNGIPTNFYVDHIGKYDKHEQKNAVTKPSDYLKK